MIPTTENIKNFKFLWLNPNLSASYRTQAGWEKKINLINYNSENLFKEFYETLNQNIENQDLCIEYKIDRTYVKAPIEQFQTFRKKIENLLNNNCDEFKLINSSSFSTEEQKEILFEYDEEVLYYDLYYDTGNFYARIDGVRGLGSLIKATHINYEVREVQNFRRLCLHTKAEDVSKLRLNLSALQTNQLEFKDYVERTSTIERIITV